MKRNLATWAVLTMVASAAGKTAPAPPEFSLVDLGTLGGSAAAARGINDRRQIVGDSATLPDGWNHAFLWEDGTMTDLGILPGGKSSTAAAINNRGDIAGTANKDFIDVGMDKIRAVLWSGGAMIGLGTFPG